MKTLIALTLLCMAFSVQAGRCISGCPFTVSKSSGMTEITALYGCDTITPSTPVGSGGSCSGRYITIRLGNNSSDYRTYYACYVASDGSVDTQSVIVDGRLDSPSTYTWTPSC